MSKTYESAINLPDLDSTVLYQNKVHQVRDRTRNKTTKQVTIWVCHCLDTNCQHTPVPAPIDEIVCIPQVSDRICHFSTREAFTLMGYKLDGLKVLFEVESKDGIAQTLPLVAFDLLPEAGDLVLVAARPYCDFIRAKAKKVRGNLQSPAWEHRALLNSLDDLWWISTPFEVRAIRGVEAICVADGSRRELPVKCLRVLQKKQRQVERKVA